MLECLLYRPSDCHRPTFYRVEIAMNLFNEVSVLREWGRCGARPVTRVNCFGNLREASHAADRFRNRALKRGYLRPDA